MCVAISISLLKSDGGIIWTEKKLRKRKAFIVIIVNNIIYIVLVPD